MARFFEQYLIISTINKKKTQALSQNEVLLTSEALGLKISHQLKTCSEMQIKHRI